MSQSVFHARYWRDCARLTTQKLCVMGVLMALQIILSRITAINLGNWLRISFGFLPNAIAGYLLGPIGGMLAILGVVVLPISTGDTAFRSARLLVADTLRIDQGPIGKRLMIAVPLFTAGIALTFVDFAVIWRYFGWANQTMSCVTLWAIAVYLARRERFHWIATLPAAFMTVVCVSYLCYAKIGFGMSVEMSTLIGIASAAASLVLFLSRGKRMPELENEASC